MKNQSHMIIKAVTCILAGLIASSCYFSSERDNVNDPASGDHSFLWYETGIEALAAGINEGDALGYSAAVDGEYAVVGARYYDVGTYTNQGAAFVYRKDGTEWIYDAMLKTGTNTSPAYFGFSVDTDGTRIIVGAQMQTHVNPDCDGMAYIYERTTGGWVLEKGLAEWDGLLYGSSVAIDGDYAVVGMPGQDPIPVESHVYIYYRDPSTGWGLQQTLSGLHGEYYYFGSSVAIDGDYAVIGSTDSGVTYVYKRSGTTWTLFQELSSGSTNDSFGNKVAIEGTTAVVAAYFDDENGTDAGAVYVFQLNGVSGATGVKLCPDDIAVEDYFGTSVGISGEYIIAGSPFDDDRGSGSGSVYLFRLLNGSWEQYQKITSDTGTVGDNFGYSVAIDGAYGITGAIKRDVGSTMDAGGFSTLYFY